MAEPALAGNRMAEVVDIILSKRTGATVEEIVSAAKEKYVTGEQAVNALERQYAQQARYKQTREIPTGLLVDDSLDPKSLNEPALIEQAENLILRVLNELPSRQRQAVELYFLDNLTQEAVAQRMGIDRRTVRGYVDRACERIVSSVDSMPPFRAPKSITCRDDIIASLMALTYRKQKRHHPPIYPYELWRRYNAAGYWAGNGIYATQYEDKLSEYLEDCFGCPGVAIPRGV